MKETCFEITAIMFEEKENCEIGKKGYDSNLLWEMMYYYEITIYLDIDLFENIKLKKK